MIINVDISDIKEQVKDNIKEFTNKELDVFDFEKHFSKYLSSNKFKKIVKSYIYSYMEESEIVIPPSKSWGKEKKIALNVFVLQIVREVIETRIKRYLDNILKTEASRYLKVVVDTISKNIKGE